MSHIAFASGVSAHSGSYAASLVASYPTRLFASAHLLEARTMEASGVFATATDEFLRLADGSGWVPLAEESGERVFFAVPRSL